MLSSNDHANDHATLQHKELYEEFNLVTWLKMVKLTELNISKFNFFEFNYVCYHCKIFKVHV